MIDKSDPPCIFRLYFWDLGSFAQHQCLVSPSGWLRGSHFVRGMDATVCRCLSARRASTSTDSIPSPWPSGRTNCRQGVSNLYGVQSWRSWRLCWLWSSPLSVASASCAAWAGRCAADRRPSCRWSLQLRNCSSPVRHEASADRWCDGCVVRK